MLGFIEGNDQQAVDALTNRLIPWWGSKPLIAEDYGYGDSWQEFTDQNKALVSAWHSQGYRMVLSMPLTPQAATIAEGRSTLAPGAEGAFDGQWTALATQLIDAGMGDAVIRLGWEFNGNWFAWSIGTDPTDIANWVAYWRHVVKVMRAVPGAAFVFDWCANAPIPPAIAPDLAYPGDDVVDIIGMDAYDFDVVTPGASPQQRWQELQTTNYGLNWLAAFAAKHNKPISIPEWGLPQGDNPYYVTQFSTWMHTHNVVYACFWDMNVEMTGEVSDGENPQSGAALKAAWSRNKA
jgi:beta-mannanase